VKIDPLLRPFVEAAILTSPGPVPETGLFEVAMELGATEEDLTEVLEEIRQAWDRENSGIRLEKAGGGWRCATRPELAELLRSFHGISSRQRLSQAALEVLSIVAYRQPVTLPEINFIRASNSSSVIKTLLERRLVRMAGRKKVVGKPFLYRTTKEFLVHFGLDDLTELPDAEELVRDKTPGGSVDGSD